MKIGILGKPIDEVFGVNLAYMYFLTSSKMRSIIKNNYPPGEGVNVCVINPTDEFDETIDMLFLPGGADVLDINVKPGLYNTKSEPMFEYFDKIVLPRYIANMTIIFGICRGFQTLNVLFGGTLKQNIDFHPTSRYDKRWELAHKVSCKSVGSPKERVIKVNSLHHQGIETLGKGLVSSAKHVTMSSDKYDEIEEGEKDDIIESEGVIESFYHSELPIAGVQWHPEEIMCEFSFELIDDIINRKLRLRPQDVERIQANTISDLLI